MPRNLLAAFAISALLALLLSFVPEVKWKPAGQDIATFQSTSPIVVSEQNLVDLFTLVPTHYNIKRVKWENESIFVDFAVGPSDKVELSAVYRDFYTFAYDVFHYTSNAKKVFYRMVEEEKDQEQSAKILVAIQAERPQTNQELFAPDTIKDIKMFVEERYPVLLDPYFSESVSP